MAFVNNGTTNGNGNNGKTPLKEIEKQRLMKIKDIVENAPKDGIIFSNEKEKEKYYENKSMELVEEKIKQRLKAQAKRLVRAPGYFMKFVEEVVKSDPEIAYVFVVGSFADDNNYKQIMNDYKLDEITQEELEKIWVPRDIDIFIIYEDDKTAEQEVAYLREVERKAPRVKLDDDEKFGYEIDGTSVEKFCGYVVSDYSKLKEMNKEQVAEFKKEYSRRHKFQIPTRAIRIYQKELPIPESDGNDMIDYKQRSDADANLEKIKAITDYPKSLKEFTDKWTLYASRVKALFREEFDAASKEFEKYKDVYNSV
ncbi:MAG: hypothetical protein QXU82_02540 [Candidatus Aenigmatarchaeota archaeon]